MAPCTITGIGICADKDIVIPEKSPAGDIVTSIEKQAFWGLEDVESITFVNCNYEIGKNAFQYGEFTTLNFIGGNPVIQKAHFLLAKICLVFRFATAISLWMNMRFIAVAKMRISYSRAALDLSTKEHFNMVIL